MKPTPKYKIARRLQQLQCEHSALQQQVADLASTHSSLVFKSNTLRAWCDSMTFLQSCGPFQVHESDVNNIQLQQLQQQEQALLQQLGELESGSRAHQTAASSTDSSDPDPLLQTISPAADPMQYFREVVSRPLLLEVQSWTSAELAERYRSMVLELAMQLPFLGPPATQQAALDRIKQLVDRHFHVLASLMMTGKYDIMQSLLTYNIDTLQPLSTEPSASPRIRNTAADTSSTTTGAESAAVPPAAAATPDNTLQAIMDVVVPQLGLTQAQEDAIAFGTEQCMKALQPILDEWQQLQQQLQQHVTAAPSDSNLGDGKFVSRGASLDEQQQLSARLKIVIQKKFFMECAGVAWFIGCLTWPQLAKMGVLRWPFATSLTHVALAVHESRERRLQQKVQQREQQDQQEQPAQQAQLLAAATGTYQRLPEPPSCS